MAAKKKTICQTQDNLEYFTSLGIVLIKHLIRVPLCLGSPKRSLLMTALKTFKSPRSQ